MAQWVGEPASPFLSTGTVTDCLGLPDLISQLLRPGSGVMQIEGGRSRANTGACRERGPARLHLPGDSGRLGICRSTFREARRRDCADCEDAGNCDWNRHSATQVWLA